MLPQLEIKTMHFAYSVLGSRFNLISFLDWNNKKLSLRSKRSRVWNWIVNVLILTAFFLRGREFSRLRNEKRMSGAIVQLIFMERLIAHFFFRLNTWIYRFELVQLVNQTTDMYNVSGKKRII